MKPMSVVVAMALLMIFALTAGCNSTQSTEPVTKIDTLSSKTNSDLGYAELENQFLFMASNSFKTVQDLNRVDFSKSNSFYKKALDENPGNLDAQMGAALTEVFMVYADPEVNDALLRWEDFGKNGNALHRKQDSPSMFSFTIPTGTSDMAVPVRLLGANMIKILTSAKTDPPTISKMQEILKTKLLPRVQYALDRMAVIEQHPEYEMRISGKMQGDVKLTPVFLDLTEVYLMDAMLQGMKANVSQFLIFQFVLSSYTTHGIVEAIQPNNTTFFTLASDGKVQSANVKSSTLAAVGKIRSGINFLKNETDSQSDDIIKLRQGNNGGIAASDLDTVLSYLNKVEEALNSTMTIDVKNADSDGNDYSIEVNLGSLFANPPNNPKKDWLPAYSVDTSQHGDILWHWSQTDYASFTFPDPTFGGLFPNMTNDMLKRLLYLDQEFAWRVQLNLNANDNSVTTNTTARLVVDGKSYAPKPDYHLYSSPGFSYGYFNFSILDKTAGTADVYVTLNGVEKKLKLSRPATVQPKEYTYIFATVTAAPQDLAGSLLQSPVRISLAWMQYGTYSIERKVNSGSFAPLITIYYSNYFEDNSVVSGTTYAYRLQPFSSSFSYDIQGTLENNYSNTVTITVP